MIQSTSPSIGGSADAHAQTNPMQGALGWLRREFPFPEYFTVGFDAHESLADIVLRRVPRGGRVLDIGCGPCDKTAVLSRLGYRCTAIDDFRDPWHREGDHLDRIGRFASRAQIDLVEGDGQSLPFERATFDAVVLCDIIEHLHASPRGLLGAAIELLRDDGTLIVTVPNALNLRKRIDVLRGRTNYPPYGQFFASGDSWRGHVREYAWDDLVQLGHFLGLAEPTVLGRHHMTSVLPSWSRGIYRLATAPLEGVRDTLVLCGRKPTGWVLPPVTSALPPVTSALPPVTSALPPVTSASRPPTT